MVRGDRERWDERYRGESGERSEDPHPFMLRALDELADVPPGRPPGRGEPFDLVVVTSFFDRALWERLGEFVVPGGHGIVTGFTTSWSGARPSRAFGLESGELRGGLAGFETLLHEEGRGRVGFAGRRVD